MTVIRYWLSDQSFLWWGLLSQSGSLCSYFCISALCVGYNSFGVWYLPRERGLFSSLLEFFVVHSHEIWNGKVDFVALKPVNHIYFPLCQICLISDLFLFLRKLFVSQRKAPLRMIDSGWKFVLVCLNLSLFCNILCLFLKWRQFLFRSFFDFLTNSLSSTSNRPVFLICYYFVLEKMRQIKIIRRDFFERDDIVGNIGLFCIFIVNILGISQVLILNFLFLTHFFPTFCCFLHGLCSINSLFARTLFLTENIKSRYRSSRRSFNQIAQIFDDITLSGSKIVAYLIAEMKHKLI